MVTSGGGVGDHFTSGEDVVLVLYVEEARSTL